jgi:tetratricopeptide (TPR) repeat protein
MAFSKLSKRVNIRTFLSLGLLASFFLPWMKGEYIERTIFGYDILLAPFKNSIGRLEDLGIFLIFAYLIIIVSVYNIIRDLLQIKKTVFLNEFILGLIESILLILFVIPAYREYREYNVISFGFYSIVFFSILGIIYTYRKLFFSSCKFSVVQNRETELMQKGMLYQEAGNYSEAFICFYEAAKQNDAIACNRLGELYEKGLGMKKNINMALKWYEKAAALGDEEAKMRMEILKDEINR